MKTSEKIKTLRIEKGLSQEALGALVGVKKAAINKYETGRVVNIKRSTLQKLADALGVLPADLLDDAERRPTPTYDAAAGSGLIGDGTPTGEANIYVDDDQVLVTVRGRSMEPTLIDGDLVVVEATNVVDDQQIALVKINGDEATLKRVRIQPDGITLVGDNVAEYAPRFYTKEEVNDLPVTIEGVVIRLVREMR